MGKETNLVQLFMTHFFLVHMLNIGTAQEGVEASISSFRNPMLKMRNKMGRRTPTFVKIIREDALKINYY